MEQLQKQNGTLKQQLADSNNRINDLFQISNSNSHNSNADNKVSTPINICKL